jgi:hypothetical protein
LCRDDAIALQPGGFTVALEKGPIGHDELDFNPADPAGLACETFNQGICHDLAPAPFRSP